MFMSVATPSEVNPSDNDAADLQDLLSDYEWKLMQSESLDTSIDNIAVRLIIQPILYNAFVCQFPAASYPWLSAMCYIQPLL